MEYLYFAAIVLNQIYANQFVDFYFKWEGVNLNKESTSIKDLELTNDEKQQLKDLRPYREIAKKIKNKENTPLFTTNSNNNTIKIIYPGNIKFKIGIIENMKCQKKPRLYIGHLISKEVFEFLIEIVCDLTDIDFQLPAFLYIQLINGIISLIPETNLYFRKLLSRLNYWAFTGNHLNEIIMKKNNLNFDNCLIKRFFYMTALVSYLNYINISVCFFGSNIVLDYAYVTYCDIYPKKEELVKELSLQFTGRCLNSFFASINEKNNKILYEWILCGIENIVSITFFECNFSNLINVNESINCLLYKENMSLQLKNCISSKNYIRNINQCRSKNLAKMKLDDLYLTSEDLVSLIEFENIDDIEFDNCIFDEDEIPGKFTFVFLSIKIKNMKIGNSMISFLKRSFSDFLYFENINSMMSFSILNLFSDPERSRFVRVIELVDLNLKENFFDLTYNFPNLIFISIKSVKYLTFKINNKEKLESIGLKRISIKDCCLPNVARNIWYIPSLDFLVLYRIKNIASFFNNLKDKKFIKILKTLKCKSNILNHSDIEKISVFTNLENLKLQSCNLDSSHLIYIKKLTSHAEFRRIILTNNKIRNVPDECKGIFENTELVILARCDFSAGSIHLLFNVSESCKILTLDFSYNSLNRNDLLFISGFRKLVVLKINGIKFEGDAELDNLTSKGLTNNLKHLEIKQLNICTKDIEALSKFIALDEIRLSEAAYRVLKESNIKIPCKYIKTENK
ncbi:hypothetical protein CWI38_1296p0020 [Hamiltosporidium tvaerminnensis]|uniref:Leucine-rich repeat-containing protein n=2 Tax=Hamiltosporidium TaxID=1176354 RepID=A0A4Q9LU27_9MICR|nr:hypothetical protein CWI38_1296p0020 [Hamiltosporidium tvaerminnensis]